jgi:Flp pilus assembly protein TadG
MRTLSSPRRGGAIVELALVAVALFVLLFGMIDYGRALLARHAITSLSREAANLESRGTTFADTLQAKNSRLYQHIRTLIAKSQEAGDNTQMAGTVAIMLEEASANTAHAVAEVEKLLLPEQWAILPAEIRSHSDTILGGQASLKQ